MISPEPSKCQLLRNQQLICRVCFRLFSRPDPGKEEDLRHLVRIAKITYQVLGIQAFWKRKPTDDLRAFLHHASSSGFGIKYGQILLSCTKNGLPSRIEVEILEVDRTPIPARNRSRSSMSRKLSLLDCRGHSSSSPIIPNVYACLNFFPGLNIRNILD
jgi:hypothetical protein